MRSWKTTLSGAVSSAASLVILFSTQRVVVPRWLAITAGFILAGGLTSMGIFSKDYNVTGPIGPTAVGASPVPVAVVTTPSKDTATK